MQGTTVWTLCAEAEKILAVSFQYPCSKNVDEQSGRLAGRETGRLATEVELKETVTERRGCTGVNRERKICVEHQTEETKDLDTIGNMNVI